MPAAGKTTILEKIDFVEVLSGSRLLHEINPAFDQLDESGKNNVRKQLAIMLDKKQDFIMDGHFAFGDRIAFTEEDGELYDAFVYLYIEPVVLCERMRASEKNSKYLSYNLGEWQTKEIEALRQYCHANLKDFYVVDNPPSFQSEESSTVLSFLKSLLNGRSCRRFAEECADAILKQAHGNTITLFDGDKTLINEDSSSVVFDYRTRLYDGNFYTGYQSWKQFVEFQQYRIPDLTDIPVTTNSRVARAITDDSFILTSGHPSVWKKLACKLGMKVFYGDEMAAEAKLFITRYLQSAGKTVIAYGDGMNDYYMIKQADEGYVVRKADGTLSRSLRGKNLEGCCYV